MDKNVMNDLELSGADRIRKELEFLMNLTLPTVEEPPKEEVPEAEELSLEIVDAEDASEDMEDEEAEYEDDEYDDEYDDDEYEDDEYEDEYDEEEDVEEQPSEAEIEIPEKEDPVVELVNAARLLGLYGLDAEAEHAENPEVQVMEEEPSEEGKEAACEEQTVENTWLPTAAEIEEELRRIDSRNSLLYKSGIITAAALVTAMIGTAISISMGGAGVLLSVMANLF